MKKHEKIPPGMNREEFLKRFPFVKDRIFEEPIASAKLAEKEDKAEQGRNDE